MEATCHVRGCSALVVDYCVRCLEVDVLSAPAASVLFPLCMARTLGRRAVISFHKEIFIVSRGKTELTIGKPKVNSTFVPSQIHVLF